jgi:riboflavin kinase/FMN adenylyltransferase
VRAFLDGQASPYPGACHIGPNATFGETARSVEVHLIDFARDLYGRSMEVDFLARLRPSRRFDDLTSLLAQIRIDVDQARELAG